MSSTDSRSILDAVLNALIDPVIVTDAEGVVTFVNAAARARFGADKDVGRPVAQHVGRLRVAAADGVPLRPKPEVGTSLEAREKSLKEARDNFERAYILAELRANDWNMTRTAERLRIERSHLYRKIKSYGITPPK